MALWHVIVGLMTFWIVVLLFMGSSLHQANNEISEDVEQRLFEAMQKLDELKKENKHLKRVAADLKKLTKPAINGETGEESKMESELEEEGVGGRGEPSLAQEVVRRTILRDVEEYWYFLDAQLGSLAKNIKDSGVSMQVDSIMSISSDYTRTLLRDMKNFTNLSDDWRRKEANALATLVQKRINFLQNPKGCSTVRKLLCNINKGCGFGCQLHHLTYCFLVAYGTNRTLNVLSHGWRYSPNGGFEKYFLPVSTTCRARTGSHVMWGDNSDNAQVVDMPIVDNLRPRPAYMPQAIPADLAPRLVRLHGHPFVWWVGQFIKYLFRPQPWLAEDIQKMHNAMGFTGPIVGIHIRRTDKVGSEAAFHGVDEYMKHVEAYFSTLSLSQKDIQRRVYVASDDPSVFEEIKHKYENYIVLGDPALSKTAGLSNRYSDDALRAVILDIHFLSITDYLVCTFSSQVCRLAYELMQTHHPDASRYFRSLDDIYYFGGQSGHHQVAIVEHHAGSSDELDLLPGDKISIAGNHWDGYSKGHNERTGRTGIYPSYKVREHIDIVQFPTYPEADAPVLNAS